MSKWRAVALVLVHLAIIGHILHWVVVGETLGPVEPSEAITFSENSVISAGLIFFVISIATTLVFGRFFCGWACHLLAIQDSCLWLLKKLNIKPRAIKSRAFLIVPIGAFIYMFLYPALYRAWFGIEFDAATTEFIVEDFWATFPAWPIAVLTLLVTGFGVVYFLGAKGFCVNFCPYGAAFGAVDRLAVGRIRVTSACEGCGHCTQVCSSNVVVHQEVRDYGAVIDQECLKCLDCVSVCPKNALYFGFGMPALLTKPVQREGRKTRLIRDWWKIRRWRSQTWPEELLLSLLFIIGLFSFRGLYGSVPFLFSLGLAGLFAYWTLQALRLFYKPKVLLQGRDLKAHGKLTSAGRYYSLFAVLMIGFWVQSGYVHYQRAQAEAGYIELNDLVTGWLIGPRTLTAEQEQQVSNTLNHVARAQAGTPLSMVPREDWELSLISGWLHLLHGEEQTFQRELEHASTLIDGNTIAHNGLANYHEAAGRTKQADRWFHEATQAAPEDSQTWTNWSRALIVRGDTDQAREILTLAAEGEFPDERIFMNLGRLELSVARPEQAIDAFRSALDIKPDILEANLQLGGLLCASGEQRTGVGHFERAILQVPDDVQLRLSLTLAYSQLGELDKAERHARAANETAPERPEPYMALSQIALARGETKEAEHLRSVAESRAQELSNP